MPFVTLTSGGAGRGRRVVAPQHQLIEMRPELHCKLRLLKNFRFNITNYLIEISLHAV